MAEKMLVTDTLLTNIADAVREKSGLTDQMSLAGIAEAIGAISGGGKYEIWICESYRASTSSSGSSLTTPFSNSGYVKRYWDGEKYTNGDIDWAKTMGRGAEPYYREQIGDVLIMRTYAATAQGANLQKYDGSSSITYNVGIRELYRSSTSSELSKFVVAIRESDQGSYSAGWNYKFAVSSASTSTSCYATVIYLLKL